MAKFWRTVAIVALFLFLFLFLWEAGFINYVFVTYVVPVVGGPNASIYAAAVIRNEFGLCEKINDIKMRDLCYNAIAHELNDTRVCERISSMRGRDICFMALATENWSHSFCDRVSDNCYDDMDSDGCLKNVCYDSIYLETARRTGNISLCDGLIRSDYDRKTCYFLVAINTKNDSLCNLTHENIIPSCISYAQKEMTSPLEIAYTRSIRPDYIMTCRRRDYIRNCRT